MCSFDNLELKMCQLNVYMIDKFVSGVDVKEVFNKHHHKNFENINEEIELKEYDDKYNYYEASANRCDCGSVVGLLKDYKDKFSNYNEYLESMEKTELVKLYKIKDILSQPNYESNLNNILKVRDNMFNKVESYTELLKEKEANLSQIASKVNLNIKDQVELKKINQEIAVIKNNLQNDIHYKMAIDSYNEFIKTNELMIASRNYTLEYKKDWWQENIDLKISKTEHESHIHTNAEFNHLKFVLSDILKFANEIKIFPIWQGERYDNLKEIKEVELTKLKLEDLIFLDFKDVVTIKR